MKHKKSERFLSAQKSKGFPTCPECGSLRIQQSTRFDEVSCSECGIVIDDMPFETNEFLSESRKGAATPPGFSLAGSIPQDGKIVKHHWLISTREKNLYKAKKNRINIIKAKIAKGSRK